MPTKDYVLHDCPPSISEAIHKNVCDFSIFSDVLLIEEGFPRLALRSEAQELKKALE